MNDNFKKLGVLITILTDEQQIKEVVFDAMSENDTPVSKSRIHGWSVTPKNKNYRHMSDIEFADVLNALIKYYGE